MGGAIEKCQVGNWQRQLSGLPKKLRCDPRVKQTLFWPQHRWQLTVILVCVPERQERDLMTRRVWFAIQAVAVRRWWLVCAPAFYNKAVVSTLQIQCTLSRPCSLWYKLVISLGVGLRGPWVSGPRCVNYAETSTSWYNLYIYCSWQIVHGIIVSQLYIQSTPPVKNAVTVLYVIVSHCLWGFI